MTILVISEQIFIRFKHLFLSRSTEQYAFDLIFTGKTTALWNVF